MKLIWKSIIAICFIMLFCMGAFAAETPEIKYNYTGNRLVINGETTDSRVTLQILKYGKSISDLNDAAVYRDVVLYTKQIDLSDSGSYSFSVRYTDSTDANFIPGEYNAYIKTENQLTEFKLDLFSKQNYEDAVGLLNGYADTDNYDEFKRLFEENVRLFGYNDELYSKVSASEVLKKCMTYIKSNHLDIADSIKNKIVLNRFLVMQGIKEGTVSDINDYVSECFVEDDGIYRDYLKYNSLAVAKSNFAEKYKGALPSEYNYADFEDAFKKALILTTVRYPSGYGDVKYILVNYGSIIGITKTASDDVYRNLIGEYADVSALTKAYNDAVNAQSSGNSSGGSGSGGSGSGGSAGRGTASSAIDRVTVTGEPDNKNSLKEIDVKFTDIEGVTWASEAIIALADKGIINGKETGLFKPDDNVTREEFVKILIGAMNMADTQYSENVFTDVRDSDWFCRYVNIANENHIVNGIGDGKFGVGANITRQDMAVMLYNALVYKQAQITTKQLEFDDVSDISDYAKQAVSALYGMNAINGVSETLFDPLGVATRAQAAKVVYAVLQGLQ